VDDAPVPDERPEGPAQGPARPHEPPREQPEQEATVIDVDGSVPYVDAGRMVRQRLREVPLVDVLPTAVPAGRADEEHPAPGGFHLAVPAGRGRPPAATTP
jgi:hypothetical protein